MQFKYFQYFENFLVACNQVSLPPLLTLIMAVMASGKDFSNSEKVAPQKRSKQLFLELLRMFNFGSSCMLKSAESKNNLLSVKSATKHLLEIKN